MLLDCVYYFRVAFSLPEYAGEFELRGIAIET